MVLVSPHLKPNKIREEFIQYHKVIDVEKAKWITEKDDQKTTAISITFSEEVPRHIDIPEEEYTFSLYKFYWYRVNTLVIRVYILLEKPSCYSFASVFSNLVIYIRYLILDSNIEPSPSGTSPRWYWKGWPSLSTANH